jgi:hypothetical protein
VLSIADGGKIPLPDIPDSVADRLPLIGTSVASGGMTFYSSRSCSHVPRRRIQATILEEAGNLRRVYEDKKSFFFGTL